MSIAIMQPYIFPYIGYFQLINSVDKFVIYDDVAFIKQGWINRNYILNHGRPFLFSIPLEKQSSFNSIRETRINLKLFAVWKNNFLKTIEFSYKKAPFYSLTRQIINELFLKEFVSISAFAYNSLISTCEYLGISTEFVESSIIYKNGTLKGKDRIIDICSLEKDEQYINMENGASLYDKAFFTRNDIDLAFLSPQIDSYKQFDHHFVPSLSIIDVLMFNSKEDIQKMIYNYVLL